MFLSKYIDFFIIDESTFYIINYANGACDIIEKELKSALERNDFNSIDENILISLMERGYIFNNLKELRRCEEKIDNNIKKKERMIPNFLIIPSYDCNLSCIYCYQQTYDILSNPKNPNVWIEKCFIAIDTIVENSINFCEFKKK